MSNDATGILRSAVDNEIEAYEFYKQAAEMVGDGDLKSVFANLAKDELKHKVLLEGYISGLKPFEFDRFPDYGVSETIEMPKLTTAMRFADAIALAMKKEEEAMKLYEAFAQASTEPEQQVLFRELSNMEAGHKQDLEDVFINAACIEAW